MINNNFESFEVDKLIEAMKLLVQKDRRDGDARHILQLLIDIKENCEVLTVIPQPNKPLAAEAEREA